MLRATFARAAYALPNSGKQKNRSTPARCVLVQRRTPFSDRLTWVAASITAISIGGLDRRFIYWSPAP